MQAQFNHYFIRKLKSKKSHRGAENGRPHFVGRRPHKFRRNGVNGTFLGSNGNSYLQKKTVSSAIDRLTSGTVYLAEIRRIWLNSRLISRIPLP